MSDVIKGMKRKFIFRKQPLRDFTVFVLVDEKDTLLGFSVTVHLAVVIGINNILGVFVFNIVIDLLCSHFCDLL